MNNRTDDRILRRATAENMTGLKDPQMWREERAGRFPKRRRLTARTVGWLESEVIAWMQSRPTDSGEFPNFNNTRHPGAEATGVGEVQDVGGRQP